MIYGEARQFTSSLSSVCNASRKLSSFPFLAVLIPKARKLMIFEVDGSKGASQGDSGAQQAFC